MATLPTAEESARKILGICERSGTRPEEVLSCASIMGTAADEFWEKDVNAGLQYGQENGWFEVQNNWVRLTQAGYAEI